MKTAPNFLLICAVALSFHSITHAQRKAHVSSTPVDFDIHAGTNAGLSRGTGNFFGPSFHYAVWEFANILRENLDNQKEVQRIERQRQQSLAQLALIKSQYDTYSIYPATISDGWHSAVATDNANFCKDVKVLINNNRITRFVIDNHIPLDFMSTGEIKNARNIISLKDFNGEELSIVEVYFLFDLEAQTLVAPPVEPGYVCFWTDMKTYAHIQLTLDGTRLEPFTVNYPTEPECFSNGTICRILKPGTYSYIALGRGTIDWRGNIEVKANECVMVRLGK